MDLHQDEDTVEDFGKNSAQPVPSPIHAEVCDGGGLEIASLSHPGSVRSKNEDSFVVLRKTRTAEVVSSSLPEDSFPHGEVLNTWLLAVADGLGGHASGEVASATAMRTIVNFSQNLGSWIMRAESEQHWQELREHVKQYAEEIQHQLSELARHDSNLAGMATTITAVYVLDRHALIVNVGDSRCYLIRSHEMKQVTSDHTLAHDMIRAGADEESTQQFRNLVTRSFNTDGRTVECDLFHFPLHQGDRLLLCSDGLTDMVDDPQILSTIDSANSAGVACEQLVQAALQQGGRDNITAVLAYL